MNMPLPAPQTHPREAHGNSLSRRLIAAMLVLTVLVSTLISAAQLMYAYHVAIEAAEHRLDEIGASVTPSLEASLWQVDNPTVGLLLDGIVLLPRVSFVEVTTREGERFQRGDPAAKVLLERSYRLQHAGGYELGTLRVVLGHRQLVELLTNQAISIGITTVTTLLFSALVLFLLVRWRITRHLVTIADYTRSLNFRLLDTPLVLDKFPHVPPDELDELSASFNFMRQTLVNELVLRDRDQAELMMHRERLEHLVEERTSELAEKNALLQKQHDEMQRLASTDSLTGVYNRRRFNELANREIARCKRLHEPLSLLLLDVDHFKQINDKQGHATGDLALKELCRICTQQLREVDVLGRLGGEEFAILLPATDQAKAVLVAERVRQAIAQNRMLLGSEGGGGTLMFTASLGVSALDEAVPSIEALLRSADAALYRAKRNGRNQVCAAGLASDAGEEGQVAS